MNVISSLICFQMDKYLNFRLVLTIVCIACYSVFYVACQQHDTLVWQHFKKVIDKIGATNRNTSDMV